MRELDISEVQISEVSLYIMYNAYNHYVCTYSIRMNASVYNSYVHIMSCVCMSHACMHADDL